MAKHSYGNKQLQAARKRILASEDTCAICGGVVDKTLKKPNPMAPEVDHIVPISKGGSLANLDNLQLVHALCNQTKGNKQDFHLSVVVRARDLPLIADIE
jgi:5-methylcytosine-specific restriction endonuclease McrA